MRLNGAACLPLTNSHLEQLRSSQPRMVNENASAAYFGTTAAPHEYFDQTTTETGSKWQLTAQCKWKTARNSPRDTVSDMGRHRGPNPQTRISSLGRHAFRCQ